MDYGWRPANRAQRTFGLEIVTLTAHEVEIGDEAIEFLPDGIKGLCEARMVLLDWSLGGGARWLEAPVL